MRKLAASGSTSVSLWVCSHSAISLHRIVLTGSVSVTAIESGSTGTVTRIFRSRIPAATMGSVFVAGRLRFSKSKGVMCLSEGQRHDSRQRAPGGRSGRAPIDVSAV